MPPSGSKLLAMPVSLLPHPPRVANPLTSQAYGLASTPERMRTRPRCIYRRCRPSRRDRYRPSRSFARYADHGIAGQGPSREGILGRRGRRLLRRQNVRRLRRHVGRWEGKGQEAVLPVKEITEKTTVAKELADDSRPTLLLLLLPPPRLSSSVLALYWERLPSSSVRGRLYWDNAQRDADGFVLAAPPAALALGPHH